MFLLFLFENKFTCTKIQVEYVERNHVEYSGLWISSRKYFVFSTVQHKHVLQVRLLEKTFEINCYVNKKLLLLYLLNQLPKKISTTFSILCLSIHLVFEEKSVCKCLTIRDFKNLQLCTSLFCKYLKKGLNCKWEALKISLIIMYAQITSIIIEIWFTS